MRPLIERFLPRYNCVLGSLCRCGPFIRSAKGGAFHLYLINTLLMDFVTHGRWEKRVTAELYIKSCQCVQMALVYPDSLKLRVKALEAAYVRDRLLFYFKLF